MEKKINLKDGGNIRYSFYLSQLGCEASIHIVRAFLINNIVKNIHISLNGDISFMGNTTGNEEEKLELVFGINDPFYSCFFHFLGEDTDFIIEDDETAGFKNKYLEIKKEEYSIKLVFHNYVYNEMNDYHHERYRAFIKNYGPDVRSKIDCYDAKIRIINLIRSLEALVKDEYYQMTIQEYLERLNYQNDQKIMRLKIRGE